MLLHSVCICMQMRERPQGTSLFPALTGSLLMQSLRLLILSFPSHLTLTYLLFHSFWNLDKHNSSLQLLEAAQLAMPSMSIPTILGLGFEEISWVSPTVTFKRECVQPLINRLGLLPVTKCCSSLQLSQMSGFVVVVDKS